MNRAAIIPTGDEILSGVVTDTDSPAVMAVLLEAFPQCAVQCLPPVRDSEDAIADRIEHCIQAHFDLVILIGGSGGGSACAPSLAPDVTHSALERCLPERASRELYGKNGHLWAKLVAGRRCGTLVMNVPGPHVEAVAAVRSAAACLSTADAREADLETLIDEVANAVVREYGTGAIVE